MLDGFSTISAGEDVYMVFRGRERERQPSVED